MDEITRTMLQSQLADIEMRQTNLTFAAKAKGAKDGNLSASDQRKFDKLAAEAEDLEQRLKQDDTMQRELRKVPRATNTETLGSRVQVIFEPSSVYRQDLPNSFFGDLVNRNQSFEAEARIRRHQTEINVEQRAITTTSGGPGLVPPQYLLDQIATFARAGRVTANLCQNLPLPDVGMTFNIPRVTTGSTTAVQASEAGAIQDSSPVTDYLALAVNTVAGKIDLSRQLFDRSNPSVDTVLAQDLAADYAKQLDTQLLSQATNGVLNLSGTNSITYTDGTPTVPEFYPKLADAIQQVAVNRFAPATAIVMHPRRWAWTTAALDSQTRPLVVPEANSATNAIGVFDRPTAEGAVGTMQGLPVFLDANIPITLGAGTNEDRIIVARFDDDLLFEDPVPTVGVYEGVLSANLQVRIAVWGSFALTFARYAKANSIISGTGLTTPTF
jgi:HK97 family phage major capsid protein